jgi:predicted O-methyltransferase YrrM
VEILTTPEGQTLPEEDFDAKTGLLSQVDGCFLYDLIVQNGCQRGLEIGTYKGYSTLWLGLAFRKTSGKVITI